MDTSTSSPYDPWPGRAILPWYRRYLAALADWFFQRQRQRPAGTPVYEPLPPPAPQQPAPARTATARIPQVLSFRSPANGDTFDFEVQLHCDWRATGPAGLDGDERLQRLLAEYHNQCVPELQSFVRQLTRCHDAHDSAAAERTVNDALARWQPLEPSTGADVVSCTVYARLGLDPEIRGIRRGTDLARVKSSSERHEQELEIERLGETIRRWKDLIDGLPAGPEGSDAVQLALEPQDKTVLTERYRPREPEPDPERDELSRLAWKALDRFEELGFEEAVYQFDSALRDLLVHLEIPRGQRLPGQPFGRPLEDGGPGGDAPDG